MFCNISYKILRDTERKSQKIDKIDVQLIINSKSHFLCFFNYQLFNQGASLAVSIFFKVYPSAIR